MFRPLLHERNRRRRSLRPRVAVSFSCQRRRSPSLRFTIDTQRFSFPASPSFAFFFSRFHRTNGSRHDWSSKQKNLIWSASSHCLHLASMYIFLQFLFNRPKSNQVFETLGCGTNIVWTVPHNRWGRQLSNGCYQQSGKDYRFRFRRNL